MDQWWTDHLINPQTMAGLYSQEPSLKDFELRELQLDGRGASCTICGDLAEFPEFPKPNWDENADRLELRLNLTALDRFEAHGDAAGGHLDLTVDKAESGLGVVIRGEGEKFHFQVEGVALQVLGLRAYRKEGV